jgi:hypothetical protein
MLSAYLIGDAEVIRHLEGLPDRLRAELKVGIGRAALKLQREVVQQKLNGQVLKRRTGHLMNSVNQAVSESGTQIVGIVSAGGPTVKYARAHEYGFSGTVTVKEHLRLQTMAFGRPMEPRQVTVKAHSMKMNLPERSFLRSALRDITAAGVIQTEIDGAISRAKA